MIKLTLTFSTKSNSALPITRAKKGTREKLYHQLGLEFLKNRGWWRKFGRGYIGFSDNLENI